MEMIVAVFEVSWVGYAIFCRFLMLTGVFRRSLEEGFEGLDSLDDDQGQLCQSPANLRRNAHAALAQQPLWLVKP